MDSEVAGGRCKTYWGAGFEERTSVCSCQRESPVNESQSSFFFVVVFLTLEATKSSTASLDAPLALLTSTADWLKEKEKGNISKMVIEYILYRMES